MVIYIIDDNIDFSTNVKNYLPDDDVFTYQDCELAFNDMTKNQPDVVVCDLLLSKVDGFELIEKINIFFNHKVKIIVCSSISQDKFVAKAMNMGVSYYLLKPISFDVLKKRIYEINDKQDNVINIQKTKQSYAMALNEKISYIFMTVGIPAHIKGYKFLREAIKLCIDDPNIINSITKKLYPEIAKMYETTSSKVERAIRHAIEVAWNKGKIDHINKLFGVMVYSANEKPTNGEFIALVADKMLMELYANE